MEQTNEYIKIHCPTYISRILKTKSFDLTTTQNKLIPMPSDTDFIKKLDTSVGPKSEKERLKLERDMGFKYRAATGELLFAMVTCRPDISNAVIKLTQFNSNPAECHYAAVMQVFRYLDATKHDGITYWRKQPRTDLKSGNLPTPQPETYPFETQIEHDQADTTYVLVDSDWAGNVQNRRSVGGIAIMMAGAKIVYKTILQRTVALSSTEAEYYALSEAGKLTLYPTEHCPLCLKEETRGHYFICDHQQMQAIRTPYWKELVIRLSKNTASSFKEIFITGLSTVIGREGSNDRTRKGWPRQFMEAYESQLEIGWEQVMYGRISKQWKEPLALTDQELPTPQGVGRWTAVGLLDSAGSLD